MWPNTPDGFEPATGSPSGAVPDDALYFLCVEDRIAAVREHGVLRPILRSELRWYDIEVRSEHYLGRFRNQHCYAAVAAGTVHESLHVDSLFSWLGRVEPPMFYLAGRAQQILSFHATHKFCGCCGGRTELRGEDNARVCASCGHAAFPRLSPSIIVLVTRGERMLLARNAKWPHGMYSTLAGFVEPGESIEQTVHREVSEEVGLEISDLRYRGSQSWPFPNSLMLGFRAEYAAGDIVCQPGEIDDARWFYRDELPHLPPPTAISRWLINEFIAEQRR